MACKRDPQLSKNALQNLSEIFRVNGKPTLLDFLEESDKYLVKLTEEQLKEVKNEIIRFTNSLPKKGSKGSKGSKGFTRKRKFSKGGDASNPVQYMMDNINSVTDTIKKNIPMMGGSFNPGPPGGPPGFSGIPGTPGSPPIQAPLRVVQMLQPMIDPMGSPVPMMQPAQMQMGQPDMPRGPQGPGIVRGIVRVGVTFFVPRSTTGIIYSGIWLGIALLAAFSAQQHRDFLMLGVEQITSGSCMGTMGYFDVARHPLCTRWRELMAPILTALNEVMKFNITAMSVLTAGIGAAVSVPFMIDAVIYELAYNMDFVVTTALQSFSGRPLISPLRSPGRLNFPQLMSRTMGLSNPGTMSALTLGQQPNLSQPLGNQYFVPVPGQPYAQAYPVPYAQPYAQPFAQPFQQPFQHPFQQPFQQPFAQQYDPRMAQQYDPQQAAALWDQRMAPPPPRLPGLPNRGRTANRVRAANQVRRNANNANNVTSAEENAAYEAYDRARSASRRRRAQAQGQRDPGGSGNGRRSSNRNRNRNRGGPGNGGPGNNSSTSQSRRGRPKRS